MRGPLRDEKSGDEGGGGGGGAPTFDPAAFKAELLGEIRKMIPKPEPQAKTEQKTEPEPEPDAAGKKTPAELKFERELQKLRGELDNEKKARNEATEAARKEKRTTTLTNELGKLGVAPERIKSALRAVDPDVKFAEDGSLVGDDDTPLSEYLATWIKGNEHFLPAKPVGGAGATSGMSRGAAKIDIDSIRPGMKAEELAAVRAEIASVLKGQ